MKLPRVLSGLLLLLPLSASAAPTAEQIIQAMDKNMTFETREATLRMTVTKRGREKVFEMHSYGRGADESAIEFNAPARDKGTRMLKKGGELWTFLPNIEKTQKISGHMLRQGLMGSDFSYEDMLESSALLERYDATLVGEEPCGDGATCYKLELKAKSDDVNYPKRISWVDKERSVPVREELYALSGMLLKVFTFEAPQQYGERWFPTTFTADDQLQQDSKTELHFEELAFKVPVEDEVFSLRWLER
ncbi:MAG: outer membrane lipoprotein-sorting protein [Alphaproteobacteria bacterium]|nr:outer membrane lipoprotein-sorting protein [Alphaproteobacteria bacterium]